MKTALITGITGQDGSYLAEHLLERDYVVHGIVRRQSNAGRQRLEHLVGDDRLFEKRLFLHDADLDDVTTIRRVILRVMPDEFYHLAGQSHVGLSFEIPESTCELTAMGTLRILEILRDCEPTPKFLHISSSEIFGSPESQPQGEGTPHRPVTPYGVAKSFASNMVRVYRDSFGLFACNAICFNHESPRRGDSFVTQKIAQSAARIKLGMQNKVALGNLDAERDWGYAPDFVAGFHAMLQQERALDLVLATGVRHKVRDWLEIAFGHVGLDWRQFVEVDSRFVRKADPSKLVGDPRRAQKHLGWQPSTSFESMVVEMVEQELNELASVS